jgi:hypothetical protein
LAKLSEFEENHKALYDKQVLNLLRNLVYRKPKNEILENVSKCYCYLSATEKNEKFVEQEWKFSDKDLEVLLKLTTLDFEVSEYAFGALGNLACSTSYQKKLFQMNSLESIHNKLTQSDSVEWSNFSSSSSLIMKKDFTLACRFLCHLMIPSDLLLEVSIHTS